MAGINKVIVLGRVGSIETKVINGKTIVNLSVATSEKWNDKNGQKQERTEWHRWVAFGKTAEAMSKYVDKGQQLYLEGKVQTTTSDQGGVKKYYTKFIVETFQFGASSGGGSKDRDRENTHHEGDEGHAQGGDNQMGDFGPEPEFGGSEDIPF